MKILFMSLTVKGLHSQMLRDLAHSSPIRPDRLLVATRNADNVSNARFGKLMISLCIWIHSVYINLTTYIYICYHAHLAFANTIISAIMLT